MIINFEPLSEDHFSLMKGWLDNPDVLSGYTSRYSEFHYREKINSPSTRPFLFLIDKRPAGYIQYWKILDYIDESPAIASFKNYISEGDIGIDLFIGEDSYRNKGFGVLILQSFINFLHSTVPNINNAFIDPVASNIRAVKCYQKAGFSGITNFIDDDGKEAILMRYTRM